jgi:hypothetical protein
MTNEEQTWLLKLVRNPPTGSKLEAARDWGIDLTLYLTTLPMTPQERLENMVAVRDFLVDIRNRKALRS